MYKYVYLVIYYNTRVYLNIFYSIHL